MDLNEILDGQTQGTAPPSPPTPEANPETGPPAERVREHRFKTMSAKAEAAYGEDWCIRYIPDGQIHEFNKFLATNPDCEIVPRVLLDRQIEKEKAAEEERIKAEREEEIERRLEAKRLDADVDDEVERRWKAEQRKRKRGAGQEQEPQGQAGITEVGG